MKTIDTSKLFKIQMRQLHKKKKYKRMEAIQEKTFEAWWSRRAATVR